MKNSAKPFEIGLHTAHSKNLLSESLLQWGEKGKIWNLVVVKCVKTNNLYSLYSLTSIKKWRDTKFFLPFKLKTLNIVCCPCIDWVLWNSFSPTSSVNVHLYIKIGFRKVGFAVHCCFTNTLFCASSIHRV